MGLPHSGHNWPKTVAFGRCCQIIPRFAKVSITADWRSR